MATTIKQKAPIIGPKKKLVFFENGRKIIFIVPDFKGKSIILKNAYDDDVWHSNGTDSQNYRKQINDTMVALEGDPKTQTAHHDQPIGRNNKDLRMVLVSKEEHKKQKHYGASSIANPDKRKQYIKEAGNWDISKLEYAKNYVDYQIHKHPSVTACIVGGTTTVITNYAIKKVSPKTNKIIRICTSLGIGILSGIITNIALKPKDTYYADSSFKLNDLKQ
ncbi:MAG TPA: hypothetical protein OIM59_11920 [Bacteroides mediterraneensis]|uniref:hypothetical protein n=1 Tax=Bacteroides mediterraneensis TaxID=1841856 RepID=UPI0026EEFF71|nr:hypothetical protein [Bacteroides mediterraneensis]HJH65315.1 hypothetical protein [Bacteroides mediterraneensis]